MRNVDQMNVLLERYRVKRIVPYLTNETLLVVGQVTENGRLLASAVMVGALT